MSIQHHLCWSIGNMRFWIWIWLAWASCCAVSINGTIPPREVGAPYNGRRLRGSNGPLLSGTNVSIAGGPLLPAGPPGKDLTAKNLALLRWGEDVVQLMADQTQDLSLYLEVLERLSSSVPRPLVKVVLLPDNAAMKVFLQDTPECSQLPRASLPNATSSDRELEGLAGVSLSDICPLWNMTATGSGMLRDVMMRHIFSGDGELQNFLPQNISQQPSEVHQDHQEEEERLGLEDIVDLLGGLVLRSLSSTFVRVAMRPLQLDPAQGPPTNTSLFIGPAQVLSGPWYAQDFHAMIYVVDRVLRQGDEVIGADTVSKLMEANLGPSVPPGTYQPAGALSDALAEAMASWQRLTSVIDTSLVRTVNRNATTPGTPPAATGTVANVKAMASASPATPPPGNIKINGSAAVVSSNLSLAWVMNERILNNWPTEPWGPWRNSYRWPSRNTSVPARKDPQASSLAVQSIREAATDTAVGPSEGGNFALPGVDPVTGRSPSVSEELIGTLSITQLGYLLHTRQLTSRRLTELFIARLQRYDPILNVVVTFTEDLAYKQADEMDRELEAGRIRGPLHGIPFGMKDTYSVPGYPTTWGVGAFRDRVIDEAAAVYQSLRAAGAVLVGKLSTGTFAWGDNWFRGRTTNPWNPTAGSCGSSAGSAVSVVSGLLPFAIGTETWGSILCPATTTGVSAFRPSAGLISLQGNMPVAPSLDKGGVFCRYVEDCNTIATVLAIGPPSPQPGVSTHSPPIGAEIPPAMMPPPPGTQLRVGFTNRTNPEVLKILRSYAENGMPGKSGGGGNLATPQLNLTLVGPLPMLLDDVGTVLVDDVFTVLLQVETSLTFADFVESGLIGPNSPWWKTVAMGAVTPAPAYLRAGFLRQNYMRSVEQYFRSAGIDVLVRPTISLTGQAADLPSLLGLPEVMLPVSYVPRNTNRGGTQQAAGDLPMRPMMESFFGLPLQDWKAVAVAQLVQSHLTAHTLIPPFIQKWKDQDLTAFNGAGGTTTREEVFVWRG